MPCSGEIDLGRKDIRAMTLAELEGELTSKGLPRYRASQIYAWLQKYGASSFSEMTNIGKPLRENLAAEYELASCRIDKRLVSALDGTVKYLFELRAGEYVESAVMHYRYGSSVCVSSQLGCKMGCTFCASALGGFQRDLTAGEMLAQVFAAQRDLGIRISRLVLMGIGEPLDNFKNVLRFLELATDKNGLDFSIRHISLSTCGIVPRIYELADKGLGLTLSVSLHAPNDRIRSRLMPVNSSWGVEELLKACRYYAQKTSRRISFEYAMISGLNDSDACAGELARRLRGLLCHVNLIPVNNVRENDYRRSSRDRIKTFSDALASRGIPVTVRRTLGSDINASCGQLRTRKNGEIPGSGAGGG